MSHCNAQRHRHLKFTGKWNRSSMMVQLNLRWPRFNILIYNDFLEPQWANIQLLKVLEESCFYLLALLLQTMTFLVGYECNTYFWIESNDFWSLILPNLCCLHNNAPFNELSSVQCDLFVVFTLEQVLGDKDRTPKKVPHVFSFLYSYKAIIFLVSMSSLLQKNFLYICMFICWKCVTIAMLMT